VVSPSDNLDLLREHPVREVVTQNGVVLVRLGGELDVYNAGLVRDALVAAARRTDERVVIDLAEVGFVDSTLLGVLVESRTHLANRRAFLLAAPGLAVRRALEVSGLDRHFEVHESVDSALAARLPADPT
jgi:anti-sigma B factor antagonist